MALVADKNLCAGARLARDARFDGLFFIAVKTTGIYCRPICPAKSPLEKNVEYHDSAVSAAQSGYRPCLRCRPDSAPHSSAWQGTQTSFQRALSLINDGVLQDSSIEMLAERLGISTRYLRDLFQQNLGISPKKVAIYQQCLFAKQLLHDSLLAITDIAYASGFNSVRRFNEAMQEQIGLAPREIRKHEKTVTNTLRLKLYYRPPYAWSQLLSFLQSRVIPGLEWVTADVYSRTIRYQQTSGYFSITNRPKNNYLELSLHLSDYTHLNLITQRIRVLFDVDAPIKQIDDQLGALLGLKLTYLPGLRIPGIWSSFEAGVRAILGQQVSVQQANKFVTLLVDELGENLEVENQQERRLFPQPKIVSQNSLDFFRMPQARKDAIRRLAEHFVSSNKADNIDDWLALKGIGPWTVNYVNIRASKNPDVWLEGDAGVKNALKLMSKPLDIDAAKPWRSYLVFQLWNQLHLEQA